MNVVSAWNENSLKIKWTNQRLNLLSSRAMGMGWRGGGEEQRAINNIEIIDANERICVSVCWLVWYSAITSATYFLATPIECHFISFLFILSVFRLCCWLLLLALLLLNVYIHHAIRQTFQRAVGAVQTIVQRGLTHSLTWNGVWLLDVCVSHFFVVEHHVGCRSLAMRQLYCASGRIEKRETMSVSHAFTWHNFQNG